MSTSGVPPQAIRAVSAGTTSCTVVALDDEDRPLRPAMIWMDVRAADEAEAVAGLEHVNRRVDGLGVSAEWFPCKALWLKRHEPEVWSQATRVVECIDWFMHRLAGTWTGSITAAAIRASYDRTRGGWPADFYEALSLGELMAKVPHDVRVSGEPLGTLLPGVAAELGLSPSTLVTQGGVDAFVAQVGLNVLAPGRTALITGSSHLHLGQVAEEVSGRGFFGGYADAVVPGQWTI